MFLKLLLVRPSRPFPHLEVLSNRDKSLKHMLGSNHQFDLYASENMVFLAMLASSFSGIPKEITSI
jgi:hypothetical protein